MIELETFKKCIEAIYRQEKIDDDLTKLLVPEDCTGWVSTGEELIRCMTLLLKDVLGDKYDYIEWWLYDAIEGDKAVWYKEIKYHLDDLQDLYYYIIGEYSKVKQEIETNDITDNAIKADDVIEMSLNELQCLVKHSKELN
jgi:hypothetical protein